jgi:UDP-N-acetylglucosamine transferase subunit ALG13
MIFATIGTTEPFDRLLRALDSIQGDLVVQCGDGNERPHAARCVDYVSYDELVAYIRDAEHVVSHAGVGTILTALAAGKRPIVVPRRKQFGEAVDDHQVELARHLAELGLVTLVEEPSDLAEVLRDGVASAPSDLPSAGRGLATEVRAYLDSVIRSASRPPSREVASADRLVESGHR